MLSLSVISTHTRVDEKSLIKKSRIRAISDWRCSRLRVHVYPCLNESESQFRSSLTHKVLPVMKIEDNICMKQQQQQQQPQQQGSDDPSLTAIWIWNLQYKQLTSHLHPIAPLRSVLEFITYSTVLYELNRKNQRILISAWLSIASAAEEEDTSYYITLFHIHSLLYRTSKLLALRVKENK